MVEINNFMCHKHQEFKLGPRINFICGKNGSGKSAILTAIVLCLGGKASSTNRASSLKDLIQQGKENASIICRIKNDGEGSYAAEDYGKVISVERHFSRSGTASFKIKSEQGRIISTKRADLDAICDHFGFQVENPMSVLTQDLARQFITSSNPAEKYRLFVKGVLLEQLDQDYCIIEQNVSTFEPRIEDAKKDLEQLKNTAEIAKNKAEASERFDTLKATFRDWRRQLAWEQVRLKECDKSTYAEEIQSADEKITGAEAQVAQLDTVFRDSTVKSDATKEASQQAEIDVQNVRDQKKEEEARLSEAKKDVTESHNEQRTVKGALSQAVAAIDAKEKAIEEETNRLAEVDGGGSGQRLRELREAETAVEDAKAEEVAHKEREPPKAGLDAATKAFEKAEKMVRDQKIEVETQTNRLHAVRNASDVKDTAYGFKMPQLLKAIAQERGFRSRPVGPLGKHVKLLHPEWSSILEKSFGSSLSSFIVTSKDDQGLLSRIIRNVAPNAGINVNIVQNTSFDVSHNEPDEHFLTVLRALEIDDPLVRKFLIWQHYIETIVLIPDQQEASNTVFPKSGPQPHNIPRCYCFHESNKSKGYMLHKRGGRPAQDPIEPFRGETRMRSNAEAQIRVQQGILDDAKRHLLNLEDDARSCRKAVEKAKQELVRYKKTTHELKLAIQEAEDLVESLQEAISEDNVKSGNLESLRKQLEAAKAEKDIHEGSFMDVTNSLDSKKKAMRAINATLNAFDEQIKELSVVANTNRAEAQKADKDRAHALGEKNAAIARVEDGRKDRATMNDKMAEIDEVLQQATEQATALSARVNFPEGETFDSLSTKYDRRRKELATAQKRLGGTREELEAEKAKTTTAYAQAQKDVDELMVLSTSLTGTMHNRRERWAKFQRFISVSAKFNFGFLLGERGFRGQLLLDHTQHLLDLRVEPDVTVKKGKGRSTNTLSGGEKSFSQICLLLAIWEAMGSPIRCLDEFDVFMDAVNRNRSASLLIDGARASTGKQFILISPGSKSDIPIAPDVNRIE